MEKISYKNKFVLHPYFKERVHSLRNKIDFSDITAKQLNISVDGTYCKTDGKLTPIEQISAIKLNPYNGKGILEKINCLAYDESIDHFEALEGSGYITCHSMVAVDKTDYLSSNCLSFGFYTRSKHLLKENPYLRPVNENSDSFLPNEDAIESSFKEDYHKERNKFILNNCPGNAVLFIDGPIISGLKTVYTIKLNEELLNKSVIPIFIVKNSSSNLVCDKIPELNGFYNSDLHWANKTLKAGERSNFFKYIDDSNAKISKIFCYIKPFENNSPQRIEFHEDTYRKYEKLIPELMDLIYYFYIDQGPEINVQIRPIVIAEMYARETKKMINIRKILKESDLQVTMNEKRGM